MRRVIRAWAPATPWRSWRAIATCCSPCATRRLHAGGRPRRLAGGHAQGLRRRRRVARRRVGRGPDLRPHAARPTGRVLVRDALLAAPGRRHTARARRGTGGGGADAAGGLRRRRRWARSTSAIVTQLVVPDTERQVPGLSHAYHPWFPVLLIGAHKAELYTRALVGDIVHKRNNLADPGWLVRVGLYLEFLTALGIIEGVDPSVLSAEERAAFEIGPGVRADPAPHQSRRVGQGLGTARDRRPWPPANRARRGPEPAGQAPRDAAVPARPPRRSPAGHRARRAQSGERAGDLAPGLPRRRARRAAPDAGRLPGARRPARRGAQVRALAPAWKARVARPGPAARSCSAIRTACSPPRATSTATR